jgi:hypothetical protein
MSTANTGKQERGKHDAVQRLWDTYVGIIGKRGVDLPAVVATAAERVRDTLMDPGARIDFDQLCEKGCIAEILALLVGFLRFSPNVRHLWSEMVGQPEKRNATIRKLRRAADAIDDVFAELVKHDKELPDVGTDMASPAKVAASLRFYCRVLDLSEVIVKEGRIRSSEEMAKFLLASYVERATGKACDRNVSGIIAEVLGPVDHNEVAQRMWRHRNSKRLKENLASLADLLHAGGVAVSRRGVTKSPEI